MCPSRLFGAHFITDFWPCQPPSKSRYKTLCQRCGWHLHACGSPHGRVHRRILISEDGSRCDWFEDAGTMTGGFVTFRAETGVP